MGGVIMRPGGFGIAITLVLILVAYPPPAVHAQRSDQVCSKHPIAMRAMDFTRSSGIEVGRVPEWGLTSIHNAPPYTPRVNSAEYDFNACAATYQLTVEYAAAESRAVEIYVNGKLVIPAGLAAITGGWSDAHQRWLPQGEVTLRSGRNTLRLKRDNYFPHIRAFRLTPL
jgi:hypothetical protein